MALVGAGLERTLIRPMYGRDQVDALLLTFGLTYILIEGVRYDRRLRWPPGAVRRSCSASR